MRRWIAYTLPVTFFAFLVGCGGKVQSGSTPSTPSVTAVLVSCDVANVLSGQTSQCTAQVAGTGSYSSTVNWSIASAAGGNEALGSISATGLYTAPTTIPSPNSSVTITATSQQTASVAGTAVVSLSYPSPVLSSVLPGSIASGAGDTSITVSGSNFTPASVVDLNSSALPTSFISSTSLQATIPASSLVLATSLPLSVSTPAPGGGVSASEQIAVVPQLLGIVPSSASVGQNAVIQLSGVSSANASAVSIAFLQTGNGYNAIVGSPTFSGNVAQIPVTVPAGLAPASLSAALSAPAQIAASLSSIPAPTNLAFTVIPPVHAGAISPSTVTQNATTSTTFSGIATSFDATTTVVSDDPMITFSSVTPQTSAILQSTMTVGSGAVVGLHIITVTTDGVPLTYSLQVAAANAPSTVSAVSPSSAAPAAPIVISGSGFGTSGASDVQLLYSYQGNQTQIPAVSTSDTEIDTFMPVLTDSSSAGLYSGAATLTVVVNGQSSSPYAMTLQPLPPNTGATGVTTLALIDSVSNYVANAQSQLANVSLVSAIQAQSAAAFYSTVAAQLSQLRADIAAAASGQTIVNADGGAYDATTVDELDRLLQAANLPEPSSQQTLDERLFRAVPLPLDLRPLSSSTGVSSAVTDTTIAVAGQFCTVGDVSSKVGIWWGFASDAVCLAAPFYPPALSGCAVMKAISVPLSVVPVLMEMGCNAEPITLASVTPSPISISTTPGGPSVIETPTGAFTTSPKQTISTPISMAQLVLNSVGIPGTIVKAVVNNHTVAEEVGDIFEGAIDLILDKFVEGVSPSWGTAASLTAALSPSTTSLMPDPNSLVGVSALSVIPGSQIGTTTLSFNTTNFRMFDSHGNVTYAPQDVQGNSVPVIVGSVSVSVLPQTTTVPVGSGQQFTATVSGSTNQGVTWSIQEGSSGGTINQSGLYTAPSVPGTFHVVATSSAVPTATGSAIVNVTATPPITYTYVGRPFDTNLDQGTPMLSGNVTAAVTFTGIPASFTGGVTTEHIGSVTISSNDGQTPVLTYPGTSACLGEGVFVFDSGTITSWSLAVYIGSASGCTDYVYGAEIGTFSPAIYNPAEYVYDYVDNNSSGAAVIGATDLGPGSWTLQQ